MQLFEQDSKSTSFEDARRIYNDACKDLSCGASIEERSELADPLLADTGWTVKSVIFEALRRCRST